MKFFTSVLLPPLTILALSTAPITAKTDNAPPDKKWTENPVPVPCPTEIAAVAQEDFKKAAPAKMTRGPWECRTQLIKFGDEDVSVYNLSARTYREDMGSVHRVSVVERPAGRFWALRFHSVDGEPRIGLTGVFNHAVSSLLTKFDLDPLGRDPGDGTGYYDLELRRPVRVLEPQVPLVIRQTGSAYCVKFRAEKPNKGDIELCSESFRDGVRPAVWSKPEERSRAEAAAREAALTNKKLKAAPEKTMARSWVAGRNGKVVAYLVRVTAGEQYFMYKVDSRRKTSFLGETETWSRDYPHDWFKRLAD